MKYVYENINTSSAIDVIIRTASRIVFKSRCWIINHLFKKSEITYKLQFECFNFCLYTLYIIIKYCG